MDRKVTICLLLVENSPPYCPPKIMKKIVIMLSAMQNQKYRDRSIRILKIIVFAMPKGSTNCFDKLYQHI